MPPIPWSTHLEGGTLFPWLGWTSHSECRSRLCHEISVHAFAEKLHELDRTSLPEHTKRSVGRAEQQCLIHSHKTCLTRHTVHSTPSGHPRNFHVRSSVHSTDNTGTCSGAYEPTLRTYVYRTVLCRWRTTRLISLDRQCRSFSYVRTCCSRQEQPASTATAYLCTDPRCKVPLYCTPSHRSTRRRRKAVVTTNVSVANRGCLRPVFYWVEKKTSSVTQHILVGLFAANAAQSVVCVAVD
jgi:hypothetical protein